MFSIKRFQSRLTLMSGMMKLFNEIEILETTQISSDQARNLNLIVRKMWSIIMLWWFFLLELSSSSISFHLFLIDAYALHIGFYSTVHISSWGWMGDCGSALLIFCMTEKNGSERTCTSQEKYWNKSLDELYPKTMSNFFSVKEIFAPQQIPSAHIRVALAKAPLELNTHEFCEKCYLS